VSQPTARQAVRSLAAKGAVRLVDRTLAGHEVEVFLPEEILAAPHEEAVPPCVARPRGATLEEMNFLKVSSRREAIHARERGLCFYCLRQCVARGRVLDHVVPVVRGGSNSYRNLVSCCLECNAQKGETAAEDFLRSLYRQRRLTATELDAGLRALEALAAGELRPILAPPAVVTGEQRDS
jgi:HNH endonuclease